MTEATITFLYDNHQGNPLLQEGWGLSLLVEFANKKILFDTGGSPEAFFANIEKMKIRLEEVTDVVFSHKHWDHRAGLKQVLEKLKAKTRVFLPKFFGGYFLKWQYPSLAFTRVSSFQDIGTKVFSFVLRGSFLLYEQTLVLSTDNGLVLITGCAHPGIITILQETKKRFPSTPIYCVVGGFHLFSKDPQHLKDIVKEFQSFGVEKVAPCHCSGDYVRSQFQETYGKDFLPLGAGSVLRF